MANVYLRSTGGADGDNGTTWDLAKATLATATTGALATASGAGDFVYTRNDHVDSPAAGAIVLSALGTVANPTRIVSTSSTSEPPTVPAYGAIYNTGSGSTNSLTLVGFAYYYGWEFNVGVGGISISSHFYIGNASPYFITLENCKIHIATTGADVKMFLGNGGVSTNDDNGCTIIDSEFEFSAASQVIAPSNGRIRIYGCSIVNATIPTTLVYPNAAVTHDTIFDGCDFSLVTGNLVNAGTRCSGRILFKNCKLGSGVTILSSAVVGTGGVEIWIENCDSSSTNYRMEHYKYQGSIKADSGIYRSSGATDGTTPISWNMTTLSAGATFTSPLESPIISQWVDSTGSSKTATIEIAQNSSATALKESEVWIQLEYLGDSNSPISSFATDHNSDVLSASTTNQTTSSVTWSGLTTPTKQSLSVTFTPQKKGYIQAKVMLAVPSITLYVDPLLTVT